VEDSQGQTSRRFQARVRDVAGAARFSPVHSRAAIRRDQAVAISRIRSAVARGQDADVDVTSLRRRPTGFGHSIVGDLVIADLQICERVMECTPDGSHVLE
jgi:hypothetical protein